MSTTTLSKTLQKVFTEIEDQYSKDLLKGYYPADAVIHAFTKGEEIGAQKSIADFKDQQINQILRVILDGLNLTRDMEEKGHKVSGFYINPAQLCYMITTPVENTYNEDFIDEFYTLSQKYEDAFFEQYKTYMRLKFIQDSGLDEDMLRADGFLNLSNGAA